MVFPHLDRRCRAIIIVFILDSKPLFVCVRGEVGEWGGAVVCLMGGLCVFCLVSLLQAHNEMQNDFLHNHY